MNIYIPDKWLRDWLDTSATIDEIKENLSLCGPSVERIEEREGEPVYDIEITTNRVDSMSIAGIAREAQAILPEFGIPSTKKDNDDYFYVENDNLRDLDIDITNDVSLCDRILAIKLEGVTVSDSPAWLQQRLLQVGQRPLNNIIDITNYVMWEVGHPIHAFDYDKIIQKKIIVRTAKEGETFTTLDNKTFTCVGGEVIFDDGQGNIIDLPGIMGTKNTVVDEHTTNVLLWIESVHPKSIRFASMTHAIRSQAAVLNEKNVDPHLGDAAIRRAIKLYQDVGNATPASKIYDHFPNPHTPNDIVLSQQRLEQYLGTSIDKDRVVRILEALECKVDIKDEYHIAPPTFRAHDLKIPEDIIEEIARIYGYHNLLSQVMATPIPDNPDQHNFAAEHRIKTWLAGWGAQEIYAYSMVSESLALASGYPLKDHIKISNPLTDDLVYMRRSLTPSLHLVLKDNPTSLVDLFELQNTYHPTSDESLPKEVMTLAIVGNRSFEKTKGLLDALLDKLHVTDTSITTDGKILVEGQEKGSIHHQNNITSIELDFYGLLEHASFHPKNINIMSHAPIIEDLTFTIPEKTHIGHVIAKVAKVHEYISAVSLKDTYKQNITLTITYRTTKTLSDADIKPIRQKVVSTVESEFGAALVGELV